jgi:23S rRNA (adenine2503-C2)-methyltransferase
MKINLAGLNRTRLQEVILQLGFPRYRADQIYQWMVIKNVYDFNHMTNLSLQNRRDLELAFDLVLPKIITEQQANDGTRKYLLSFTDGLNIEMVDMWEGVHRTVCISSQVGCALQCSFCATGTNVPFKRNLVSEEMVQQVLLANYRYPDIKVTHVVFMGMGEPLLNYENVFEAVRTLNDSQGLNLGARRITVSTVGIVPQILKMAEEHPPCNLAVSLCTVDENLRLNLVPIEQKYPLKELQEALRYYSLKSKRKLTIEYLMLNDYSDNPQDAHRLVAFLHGISALVNLIPFNSFTDSIFKATEESKINTFAEILASKGIDVTVRRSKGSDISAACGQLAGKSSKD